MRGHDYEELDTPPRAGDDGLLMLGGYEHFSEFRRPASPLARRHALTISPAMIGFMMPQPSFACRFYFFDYIP